jgi:hypothetical protein
MEHPDVEVPAAQHGEDRIAADREHREIALAAADDGLAEVTASADLRGLAGQAERGRDHGRDLDWVQGVEIVGDQEPVARGDNAAVHAIDLAAQPSQLGEHFLLDRW